MPRPDLDRASKRDEDEARPRRSGEVRPADGHRQDEGGDVHELDAFGVGGVELSIMVPLHLRRC